MYSGQLVFSQIMEQLPHYEFHKCVDRYQGHYQLKKFTCLEQFLILAFAQLTYRESLRDIEVTLRAHQSKLYHMGIRSLVSKSTPADANEKRDWRIFADFAQVLISIARPLYANEELGFELEHRLCALDSSTIDLCLSLFPWARFRETKGAVKLHTLIDLKGPIPTFIHISDGKMHDVKILDQLFYEAGSFYVMDRGYVDFERLYKIQTALAFFVTRAKSNLTFKRIYSHPVKKETGLLCDQTIKVQGHYTSKSYPEHLRRVKFHDPITDKSLIFISNNFQLPAMSIALIYKARWQVELFFKWIKQHLRIKKFYGTSENAVKTQIWISISVYLMIAILKKRLKIDQNLYTILQVLSLTLFEKTSLQQLFAGSEENLLNIQPDNQLILFD